MAEHSTAPEAGRRLLMTLGLGDEVPITGMGRVVAASEVVIGYVMLGGLLSIFPDSKLARNVVAPKNELFAFLNNTAFTSAKSR